MEKRIQLSTIIVSTEKRTNYIKECLQSLLVQKTDVIFEIILVLSKDHDSNFTFVDRKNIKIIYVKENNYCLKRNTGASVAKGDIVAYIDDDAIAEAGWVDSIYKNFNSEWKMAGGTVTPIINNPIPDNIKGYEQLIGGFNYYPEINFHSETVIGCNMFYRKVWLLEKGGFDENIGRLNMSNPRLLFGGDEVALMRKLDISDIGYIQEAGVKHLIQNSRLHRSFIISRAIANGRAKKYHDSTFGNKFFGMIIKKEEEILGIFRIKKIIWILFYEI